MHRTSSSAATALARNMTRKSINISIRSFAAPPPIIAPAAPSPAASFCRKLALIGGGQMAEAVLNAQKISGIQRMEDIWVYDINGDRLKTLETRYGINVTKSAQEAAENADIVVLAVKPQNVKTVSKQLSLSQDSTLISIVAGVTIDELKKNFKVQSVVRTMPNTPAMILEGMTVWTTTPETPKDAMDKAKLLLSKFGDEVYVTDESYLDMATAVSGSGPAVSWMSCNIYLYIINANIYVMYIYIFTALD